MKLTVLAAGAWGTALALAFAPRHAVTLWAREPQLVADLKNERENRRFLPGFAFPDSLAVEGDFVRAVEAAELVVLATPLAGLRSTLKQLRGARADLPPLLWVCKGLEAGSAKLPHQVVADELGASTVCGMLTGPSFAEEAAQGLPLAITLASRDSAFAEAAARELHSPRFRIYANDDLVGAEVGGAVKNVMAIATGICDGLGFGLNARAALITRGLAEIARLGVALGGQPATFMGLAGMGDLILTCTGALSRNRKVGLALAEGRPLAQILIDLGHVAEGVGTAREVASLAAQMGIDMPITQAVDDILQGRRGAQAAVEALLNRDPKREGQ